MASIALSAILPEATTVIGAIAHSAAVASAALVDSFAIGSMFAKDQKRSNYGGVQIQAGDEGAPIYRCIGRTSRIPGTILYASPPRKVNTGGGSGKRQEPVSFTVFHDLLIGLHWTDELVNIQRVFADGSEIIDFRSDFSADFSVGVNVELAHDRRQVRGDSRTLLYPHASGQPTYLLQYWHLYIETRRNRTAFAIQTVGQDGNGYILLNTATPHGKAVGTSFYVRVSNVYETGSPYRIDSEILHWATSTGTNQLRIQHLYSNIFPTGSPTLNAGSAVAILRDEVYTNSGQTTRQFMDIDVGKKVGLDFNPGTGPDYDEFTVLAKEDAGGELYRLILDIDDGGASGFHLGWNANQPSGPNYIGRHPVLPRAPSTGTNRRIDETDYAYPGIVGTTGTLRITQTRDNYKPNLAASWEIPYFSTGGKSTQQGRSAIIGATVGDYLVPAYRPIVTIAAREFNTSSYGNRIPNIDAIVGTLDDSLPNAITEICEEWDVTPDVSAVSGTLRGMAWDGKQEASQILQPLMLAYDLVAQETATSVRFFPRSSALSATVDTGIMLPRSDGGPVSFERSDDARRLQSVTVTFQDAERDLTPGSITERTHGRSSGEDETINLPMTLTSDEARAVALRVLRMSHLDTKVTFALPPPYADLAENDVVNFTHDGRSWRVRLTKVDVLPNWMVECDGVVEPSYAAQTNVDTTLDFGESWYGGGQSDPPATLPLATEVFTGLSLREGEDGTKGYYVAASPWQKSEGFAGAVIYQSTDDGTSWQKVGTCGPANLGYLEGDGIPAVGMPESYDATSAAYATMAGSGEIESVDGDDAAAGTANLALIGNEVVTFVDGTLQDDGTYNATNFYRGLLGTEVAAHEAGSRFLLIDDAVCFVPLTTAQTGRDVLVKVVPSGGDIDDVSATTLSIPQASSLTSDGEYLVTNFHAYDEKGGVLLIWNEVDTSTVDYYEIRRGDTWGGAPVVWRGLTPRAFLAHTPTGSRTYWIRAHFNGGLFSAGAVSTTINPTVPDSQTEVAALTDLVSSATGTTSNCAYDITNNYLEMDGAAYSATYTTTEINAGSVADGIWTLEVDWYEVDRTAIDDIDDRCDSVAAKWRTTDTMAPWELQPGADFEDAIEDVDGPVEDQTRPTYGPERGSYGHNTWVKVEVRWDTTGSGGWTDYEEFEPGYRSGQKMQVRLTMHRRSTTKYTLRVTRIRAQIRR